MPPPVTPSPFRFLPAGKRRQQSPPPRNETPVRRPPSAENDATPQRSSFPPGENQFAPTPRFSFGKAPAAPSRPGSASRLSNASALRLSTQSVEDVEDSGGLGHVEDQDEMLLDGEESGAIPTTETTQQGYDEPAWRNELPYSPKRQRVEAQSPNTASPARPVFKQPTAPASATSADPHRFLQSGSVASTDIAAPRRPVFLPSSLGPLDNHDPVPEAFSPHRRGEKWVPGGMAATLQQWVIEAGQGAAQSRRQQGYLRGEDYVLKVRIDAMSGSGPLFVEGRLPDGERKRMLLIVEMRKDVIVDLAVGRVVGIRAPTWDVEVEGGTWTVGVDWRVLKQP